MQIWSYSITTYDSAKEFVSHAEYEYFAPDKAYGSLAKAKEALMDTISEWRDDMMDDGDLGLINPNPIKLEWKEDKIGNKTIFKSSYDDYYVLVIFEMELELDELSIKGYN